MPDRNPTQPGRTMSDRERPQFAATFTKLARATNRYIPNGDPHDRIAQDAYWSVLRELPLDAVSEAAFRFAKHGEWPTAAAWAETASLLVAEGLEARRPERRPGPHCSVCDDTSWERRVCSGAAEPTLEWCGREGCRAGHTYVRRCECVATNPVIQARQARSRAKGRRR